MIMDTMHRQLQENRNPYISVIIPVFNEEQTIKRCLQALMDQNDQSGNYEVVVVDNGSNDRSIQIIQEFSVKLFSENRAHNSYMARNCGLRHAKGEIIAFIDADCIADKNWLRNLIEPFHNESVGVVAGEVLSDKPRNLVQGFYEHSGFLKQEKKIKNETAALGAGNIALRKKIFDIVGNFDEKFRWGGDNDFGIRIQKETNYLIQFAENARVYHSHRSSLKSLIKHAYTYGLGKGRFREKHTVQNKAARGTSIIWNVYMLFRFIIGIVILPLHALKIAKEGNSISESIIYPVLDKMFCIIEQIGIITFLLKKKG
ncbi:MAG TPA: glycosyltransferase [bacterium]|nr:glycosyltransferase [bacterium]